MFALCKGGAAFRRDYPFENVISTALEERGKPYYSKCGFFALINSHFVRGARQTFKKVFAYFFLKKVSPQISKSLKK